MPHMNLVDYLLYPKKCVLCQQLVNPRNLALCSKCAGKYLPREAGRQKLKFIDGWYALWVYQKGVRESIHRFKFQAMQNYASTYAQLLAGELEGKWEFDLITWVPISRKRMRRRGYDQSQLLARELGKRMDKEVVRTLKKVRNTQAQSIAGGIEARRANVLAAYAEVNAQQIAGKRILLVDDVLTTGATSEECAKMLQMRGAVKIYLATVAAVPRLQ